ncbi:MAG: hypothetical protein KF791_16580 [Verrucomicrobiae bacterium]|nr:hypothetical protein [Verrucomicrobiae bacterium]
MSSPSPAVTAWIAEFATGARWIEVCAVTAGSRLELRHAEDAALPSSSLQDRTPAQLQEWVQTDAGGAFRPNKAAPGLRRGWRCEVGDPEALEAALDALYPGALADWYAVVRGAVAPGSFRDFTGRQTGMYRVVTQLSDAEAAGVIRAGCAAAACLRRRLWTVDGLAPDGSAEKSVVPCLEPCALLLEFSRQVARSGREDRVALSLTSSEMQTIRAALELALRHLDPAIREGDFSAPANPRRLRRLRDLLARAGNNPGISAEDS